MRQAVDCRFFLGVEASVIRDDPTCLPERREILNFEKSSPVCTAPAALFCCVFLRANRGQEIQGGLEQQKKKTREMARRNRASQTSAFRFRSQ